VARDRCAHRAVNPVRDMKKPGKPLPVPELLDVHACAVWRGTTELAIRKDVERGKIPYRRHGGRILFRRGELELWWRSLDGVDVEEALKRARKV
jgi:hypothetical protein